MRLVDKAEIMVLLLQTERLELQIQAMVVVALEVQEVVALEVAQVAQELLFFVTQIQKQLLLEQV